MIWKIIFGNKAIRERHDPEANFDESLQLRTSSNEHLVYGLRGAKVCSTSVRAAGICAQGWQMLDKMNAQKSTLQTANVSGCNAGQLCSVLQLLIYIKCIEMHLTSFKNAGGMHTHNFF